MFKVGALCIRENTKIAIPGVMQQRCPEVVLSKDETEVGINKKGKKIGN